MLVSPRPTSDDRHISKRVFLIASSVGLLLLAVVPAVAIDKAGSGLTQAKTPTKIAKMSENDCTSLGGTVKQVQGCGAYHKACVTTTKETGVTVTTTSCINEGPLPP